MNLLEIDIAFWFIGTFIPVALVFYFRAPQSGVAVTTPNIDSEIEV